MDISSLPISLGSAAGDATKKAEDRVAELLNEYVGGITVKLQASTKGDPFALIPILEQMNASLASGTIAVPASPAPASTPLALGVGSPAPAPAAAPIAPATPSPEEVIGQEFLNRFPGADIVSVMDFLDNIRKTGVTYDHGIRVIQAIRTAPNRDQLIDYVEQLALAVQSGREALITDPTNSRVVLKSTGDSIARENSVKQDLLDMASAIKGTTVTLPSTGTRTVVTDAIRTATTLLSERTQLVDAIHSEFGVSLGSLTMSAYVAAAKAATTGTTTPTPAVAAVIDLLAEIDQETGFKQSGDPDRTYANRIKDLVKKALATHTLCYDMAVDNGFRNVRSDMDLLEIVHQVLSVTSARRMPTVYAVPAMPTI